MQAFGTVNGLGQSAEREKITRLALGPLGFEPKSLNEIAGKDGSFGAVGAPDRPDRGLMSDRFAHCDGGDYLPLEGYPHSQSDAQAVLTTCQQWIFQNLDAAVTEAGALLDGNGNIRDSQIPTFFTCTYNNTSGRAKCNVFEKLGLALHASQDFYSHSNWTDANRGGPLSVTAPPGLGNSAPAVWINARNRPAFPAGLITGCYDGFPESRYCDNRVKHEYLNKDKGPIDVASGAVGQGTTQRAAGNANFSRAVNGAVLDTR